MVTVTLSGLRDVVAVLPYQLGYHPRRSVVAAVLRGRRMGMVARADLVPERYLDDLLAAILAPLAREHPDGLLLVGYEEHAGEALPALRVLADGAGEIGIEVAEAVVVRGERMYAAFCREPCCPPEGWPVPGPADVPAVAAFVQAEVVPLPSREALDALVEPSATDDRAVEAAIETLRSRPTPRGRPGRAWGRVLSTADDAPDVATLPARDIAAAAHSLHDVAWRDGLIAWAAPGALPLSAIDRDVRRLLRRTVPQRGDALSAVTRVQARLFALCRRVPDSCPAEAAEVCALAAAVAWGGGHGAQSAAALERALRLRPEHRLAGLVDRMLGLAIGPSRVEEALAGEGGPSQEDPRFAAG